jgi:hypothetical protein
VWRLYILEHKMDIFYLEKFLGKSKILYRLCVRECPHTQPPYSFLNPKYPLLIMNKTKNSTAYLILAYCYAILLVVLGLAHLATDNVSSNFYATIMVGAFALGLVALKFIKR